MAGLAIVICFLAVAVLAPILAPYSPTEMHLLDRRQAPSWQHLLGLDELGRDNLSRVLFGARISLQAGLYTVLLAGTAGTLLGLLAGYLGGWTDSVLVSALDVSQAFPTLLITMVLIMFLGRGLASAVLAVALAGIPLFARVARVGVVTAKRQEYVVAAESLGMGPVAKLWRHIIPNMTAPLWVQAAAFFGTAVLEIAGLSFLGLGAQPPLPEWGAMIVQGRGAIFAAPHIMLVPGVAIGFTVLGFNLLADGLREAQSPKPAWLNG